MTLQKSIHNLSQNLDKQEKDRINRENIFVTVISSPASHVNYKNNPFKNSQSINLITLDLDFCKKYQTRPGQLEAVILHEIGHVINQPDPPNDTTEFKEYHADDYARHCGFEDELLKNLNIEINSVHDSNREELMRERISRIEANEELLIRFNN